VSKWISVEDELPSEIDDVLLLCKSKDERYTSILVGRRSPEMHPKVYGECPWSVKIFAMDAYLCMEANRIYNPHDRNHFFFGEVTHWMPLPPLPNNI